MALYLVLMTTLGAIRGVHVKEFVEGETVDLDDDDLAGVGLRDGWLRPVSEADAPPVEPLTRYTVLRHELLPPQSDWGAPPQNGDVIELIEEDAAPLIKIGAVQVAGENTPPTPPQAGGNDSPATAPEGVVETDVFPDDYTNYVALQEIQIDESGDLLLPGDKFGMSAEQAADWLEAGLIALAPAEDVAPATTPPTPPTPPQAGGNEDAPVPLEAKGEDSPVKGTRGRKAKGNQGGDSDGTA